MLHCNRSILGLTRQSGMRFPLGFLPRVIYSKRIGWICFLWCLLKILGILNALIFLPRAGGSGASQSAAKSALRAGEVGLVRLEQQGWQKQWKGGVSAWQVLWIRSADYLKRNVANVTVSPLCCKFNILTRPRDFTLNPHFSVKPWKPTLFLWCIYIYLNNSLLTSCYYWGNITYVWKHIFNVPQVSSLNWKRIY